MTILIISLLAVFLQFIRQSIILLLHFTTNLPIPQGKHLLCSVHFISIWNVILKTDVFLVYIFKHIMLYLMEMEQIIFLMCFTKVQVWL